MFCNTKSEIKKFAKVILNSYPDIKDYYIDLFCGAGGTTEGVEEAVIDGKKIAKVIWCINHDPLAIASHEANHEDCIHANEDIRTFDLTLLYYLVSLLRKNKPDCRIHLWASLECTNFSKAKGGMSRDADSRTLAEHLYRYIESIRPNYIWIENVEEFMEWGPLMIKEVLNVKYPYCPLEVKKNKKTKTISFEPVWIPVPDRKGEYFNVWKDHIEAYGFTYSYRILNSADFGSFTSRKRYFAIFSTYSNHIKWPEITHSKKPEKNVFAELKKWNPVKYCLDFLDEGESIFIRKKPICENTLKRIYAGLIRYVAGGKEAFLKQYNSGADFSRIKSLEEPCNTITTNNRFAIVKAHFLSKYYSGSPNNKNSSVNEPAGTITTIDHHSLVQAFMYKYYGNGDNICDINEPCGTITTKDRFSLVKPVYWLDKQFTGEYNHQSIEQPAGAILINDKHCLVKIDSNNDLSISILENDTPTMIEIKKFMVMYGIVDIKMRMLKVSELLKIQGFPDGYILKGNQTHQKKFIGNSVPPKLSKVLTEAFVEGLYNIKIAA